MPRPAPTSSPTRNRDLPLAVSRELFPEVCGEPVDLEAHAASIVQRTLNDGSAELQQRLIEYYGNTRFAELARARAHRLTEQAYVEWRDRLRLPPRSAAVTAAHRMWRT